MKCPVCKKEMKYFKEYDPPSEGYKCVCGAIREIPVVDVFSDEDVAQEDE